MLTYLRKLKKDGILDDATFQKILPSGSSPGVLYGLPKVHKSGCPFRPIVSSVNTYNYNLASYLVRILQPVSTNQMAANTESVGSPSPGSSPAGKELYCTNFSNCRRKIYADSVFCTR